MRLKEVERGETLFYRILFPFISFVSRMRLPDAARAVFYHKDFFGEPMSRWTQATMRGESSWSVGERELIAAKTAQWNSCPFCVGAHGAIAACALGKAVVSRSMDDDLTGLPGKVEAILPFLEKLTKEPAHLTSNDLSALLQKGLSFKEVEDAVAACVLFNITTRCADALGYEMLNAREFDNAAKVMLKRGYNAGAGKHPAHPDHHLMADKLRRAVLEGPGVVDRELRHSIAARACGGDAIEVPYETIAKKVGEAAYKITNDEVNMLVARAGSEKAAYELIVTAATGAGLYRWSIAEQLLGKS